MGFRRRVTPSRFQPALGGNRRHLGRHSLPTSPQARRSCETPGELSFISLVGLWPGQRGPIGFRVIAVRTTAGSPPLVVRGRHLTESVASCGTRGHNKTIGVEIQPCHRQRCSRWADRSTPACSLLGSDRVSEHSSLTGRRGYALVSLSGSGSIPTSCRIGEGVREPRSRPFSRPCPTLRGRPRSAGDGRGGRRPGRLGASSTLHKRHFTRRTWAGSSPA